MSFDFIRMTLQRVHQDPGVWRFSYSLKLLKRVERFRTVRGTAGFVVWRIKMHWRAYTAAGVERDVS